MPFSIRLNIYLSFCFFFFSSFLHEQSFEDIRADISSLLLRTQDKHTLQSSSPYIRLSRRISFWKEKKEKKVRHSYASQPIPNLWREWPEWVRKRRKKTSRIYVYIVSPFVRCKEFIYLRAVFPLLYSLHSYFSIFDNNTIHHKFCPSRERK